MADWYVFTDGQERGPGSAEALIAFLRNNDPSTVYVWRKGFDGWKLASDVPELAVPPTLPQTAPPSGHPSRLPLDFVPESPTGHVPDPRQFARNRSSRRWMRFGAIAGLVLAIFSAATGHARSWDWAYLVGNAIAAVMIAALVGFIAGVIADGTDVDETVATQDDASAGRRNVFARHWHGEYRLWISYWVVGVIGNLAVVLFTRLVIAALDLEKGYQPLNIFIGFAVIWTGLAVWSVWQPVGVWRSARRYMQTRVRAGRPPFWGVMAQIAVVFGVWGSISTVLLQAAPQLRETYWIAFHNDPDIPDYKIRVMRDGTEAEIVGGIKYGLANDLREGAERITRDQGRSSR